TAEDGAIAYEMGTALSDRLVHLHVEASATNWLENYAVRQGLHPTVVAFIKTRPDLLETTPQALQSGDVIAATPRSWERVSQILETNPSRRLRNVLVAGTLGEAVAGEFALLADEIAASIHIEDLLAAEPGKRWALYPATLHGLNAVVFGLIGALEKSSVGPSVEVMEGIRHLGAHRSEEAFSRMPLAELCTYGFELLIRKALDDGLGEQVLATAAYQAYAKDREAAGLG
ncbi:MAG: ATPase, partial [Pseudomonadota bacterium]